MGDTDACRESWQDVDVVAWVRPGLLKNQAVGKSGMGLWEFSPVAT